MPARQAHGEDGAAAGAVAPRWRRVDLDEPLGDRQTEADALGAARRLGAVEAVEDEGQVDRVDARARVGTVTTPDGPASVTSALGR